MPPAAPQTSRSARYIAYDGVRGGRMTVVPLRFNEGVVDEESRALQVLGLWRVASERPAINGSEQITWNWAANCRFRYDEGDRSIRVKTASGQGPDWSLRRNANN